MKNMEIIRKTVEFIGISPKNLGFERGLYPRDAVDLAV